MGVMNRRGRQGSKFQHVAMNINSNKHAVTRYILSTSITWQHVLCAGSTAVSAAVL